MKLYTNNHLYPVMDYSQLTKKEQARFDYDSAPEESFVRYRGECYDLADTMRIEHRGADFPERYTGYHGDSYFSGVIFEYPAMIDGYQEMDYCRCATYIS